MCTFLNNHHRSEKWGGDFVFVKKPLASISKDQFGKLCATLTGSQDVPKVIFQIENDLFGNLLLYQESELH